LNQVLLWNNWLLSFFDFFRACIIESEKVFANSNEFVIVSISSYFNDLRRELNCSWELILLFFVNSIVSYLWRSCLWSWKSYQVSSVYFKIGDFIVRTYMWMREVAPFHSSRIVNSRSWRRIFHLFSVNDHQLFLLGKPSRKWRDLKRILLWPINKVNLFGHQIIHDQMLAWRKHYVIIRHKNSLAINRSLQNSKGVIQCEFDPIDQVLTAFFALLSEHLSSFDNPAIQCQLSCLLVCLIKNLVNCLLNVCLRLKSLCFFHKNFY